MTVVQNPSEVRIEPVGSHGDFLSALAIREVVFIEEQSVPEGLEQDEDDARAFHLLAWDGGHAIGTGRLVEMAEAPAGEEGSWGRIGRMAVLSSYRRAGIGRRLLEALEQEAVRRGWRGIVLHAQVHARPFYLRAGYQDSGPEFDEAGIPHLEMRKRLA
jgi:predicted GNAT family N-acyltransferase